jgi:hypothetical protein
MNDLEVVALYPKLQHLVNKLELNEYFIKSSDFSIQIEWEITINNCVKLVYQYKSAFDKHSSSFEYQIIKTGYQKEIDECLLLESNCTESESMINSADEILEFLGFDDIPTNIFINFLCKLAMNVH